MFLSNTNAFFGGGLGGTKCISFPLNMVIKLFLQMESISGPLQCRVLNAVTMLPDAR